MANEDSWTKDQKLVMHELKRLNTTSDKMDSKIDVMSNKIAKLEVKASVWGAVAGAVTAGVSMMIFYLKNIFAKG